jgi:hypothetical protein
MKTIILISSIFYILGLKIGNKIDLIKKSNPVDKIIYYEQKAEEPKKCCEYTKEIAKKADCDSLIKVVSYSDKLLKSMVF